MISRFVVAQIRSSDGGAVLLKSVDTHLGLTTRVAGALVDARQPGKVRHQAIELLRQRVFGLACGYADCNDAARLADDPVHKLLVGRDPLEGAALASQPTLSRFENAVSWIELRNMAHALADTVIEQQRRVRRGRATEIHHRSRSYRRSHPRPARAHVFQRPLRHVVLPAADRHPDVRRRGDTVCRGGGAAAGQRAGQPRRARAAAPAVPRGAGGVPDGDAARAPRWRLCHAGGLPVERHQVEYVVAMASSARLEKRARRLLGKARMRAWASGRTEHVYGETRYAARTWARKRRIIIKAEVVRHPGRDPKNNPRFVVTNLPDPPAAVYWLYCHRGDVENRLKELHHGLEMDRTSSSRFLANQLRVLLALAAYILFQDLRRRAAHTDCGDAQITTLRERLVKIAVWVERSVRRIVLSCTRRCSARTSWPMPTRSPSSMGERRAWTG
jgi:hypothetical protein